MIIKERKKKWNKKGILANIVSGFITIMIAVTILPMISQELENAINCNSTNYTINESYEKPIGATGSFGGGGADAHFGGYNGEVKKSWGSNLAVVKTNESIILNPNCVALSESEKVMFDFIPFFFAVATLVIAVGMVMRSLNDAGFLFGGGGDVTGQL